MIFVNKEWDEIDDIIVYSNYHKYCRIKNWGLRIHFLMFLVAEYLIWKKESSRQWSISIIWLMKRYVKM